MSGNWCSAKTIKAGLWAGLAWAAILAIDAGISAYSHRGALTVPVKRRDLAATFLGGGTLESKQNLDIKCRVRGTAGVLDVLPDGSVVKKGDLLVRLDSRPFEEAIAAQEVVLAQAEANATRDQKSCGAAEIAIEEYRQGTFVQQRLRSQRDLLLAQRRLSGAQRYLLESQILHRRGFASRLYVEAGQFAVEKAQTDLESARLKKDVLEKFTRAKKVEELTSQRDAAAARVKSDEVIVLRQAARLKRLRDELKHCTIRAPRDGMVVYAKGSAGAEGRAAPRASALYPGAKVRQHQVLLRLADPSQMQVGMLVAESQLAPLRRGQRARVRVLGRELRGEVAFIADRPDLDSSAGESIKHYGVVIAVDESSEWMKPGMTADVEIIIQRKQGVLAVPALCVIEGGGKPRVRVKKRGRVEMREVVLGISNVSQVEVVDGLKEGELVFLSLLPARGAQ